jgi:hypothetical protein
MLSLLLHAEIVIADVRLLAVGHSLQRELVVACSKRSRGDIEHNCHSSGGPASGEIAPNENFLAALCMKLRAISRVIVSGFELDLDVRELCRRIQCQLLNGRLGARKARYKNQ